jgi:hypothetical protein
MTVQALRRRVGDDAFFRTLKAFHATFGGSNADTDDFVAIAQRESGQDLRDFFKQWLYTPGKPSEAYCYCLTPPATPATVNGTVPATLALTVGTTATFDPFIPGVAREYVASTTANVTSSAGDAALAISDPSPTATGHLVNGSFSLPQALQARASNATSGPGTYAEVGAAAAPLLTWSAPVSNDAVALDFRQAIGAGDALRTGSYGKTLTLTLSTTSP